MIRSISISVIVLIAVGALLFFTSTVESESAEDDARRYRSEKASNLPQVVKGIRLSSDVNFAGEVVPNIADARERVDREMMVNSYRHSATLHYMKLANRYFPIIEPILAQEGVPDDVKYLAVAESGLRNASSPAGAKGVWQFLASTGKEYRMTVNSEVDERYHVEKATHAACRYLKKAKEQFGTWTEAAASYNMGKSRLRKLQNSQKETDYYNMEMNEETSRYVPRIIALKEIMSNPNDYGFYLDQDELYPPFNYRIVEVSGAVPSWADFAHQHGTTYRVLKVYNPWLRASLLTNSAKKTYQVKIPN